MPKRKYYPNAKPKRKYTPTDMQAKPTPMTEGYKRAKELRSSSKWTELSRKKLKRSPVCEWCGKDAAEEVHHIQGVTGNPELVYEYDNLLSVSHRCHMFIEARHKRGEDTAAQIAERLERRQQEEI